MKKTDDLLKELEKADNINDFILKTGPTLGKEYKKVPRKQIWIHKTSKVDDNVLLRSNSIRISGQLSGSAKIGITMHTPSSNNGVFISDTDNLVTLMYALAYTEDPAVPITTEEYWEKVYPVARALEGRVMWNKIFLLPPKNKFVDDGSRYMKQASIDERIANFEKLTKLLKDFGLYDKVEILDGDFKSNFNRVKDYINGVYEE